MMARLEVKEKVGKKWQHMSLKRVAGKTLGETFDAWDGQDVVMKVSQGEKIIGMVCGTAQWRDYYQSKKHTVYTFLEAIEMLERSPNADLLKEPMAPDHVDDIFGGEFLRLDFPCADGFFEA